MAPTPLNRTRSRAAVNSMSEDLPQLPATKRVLWRSSRIRGGLELSEDVYNNSDQIRAGDADEVPGMSDAVFSFE